MTSEESISTKDNPKQKTSSFIDSSDCLSCRHCDNSLYSRRLSLLNLTIVVARNRPYADVSDFDVTVVRVDIYGLASELSMCNVL
jgi:hypothetical protein